MAEVSLRGVNKRFGKVPVIQDIDLDITAGECCCFVGPSGCGKSTLLRLIAGLEDVSTGDIRINGESVVDRPPSERGVAMVFQSYALYPHMTVYQNMAFGLRQERLRRTVIRARVEETARMLRIEALLDRLPRQLSGGQRQRVAIGRAIVRQPRIFLFDEPLSNLDAALRQQTRVEIAKLHAELDATMIYVTHDQVEAMTLADRIVVLNDGRVAQIGAPLDLYHTPANRFVAGFIGSPPMNFLPAVFTGAGATTARLTLPAGATLSADVEAGHLVAGSPVTCGIRPEHLTLSPTSGADLCGQIVLREQLGDHSLIVVSIDDQETTVTAKVAPDVAPPDHGPVGLRLPAMHCHLFDQQGQACRRLGSAP